MTHTPGPWTVRQGDIVYAENGRFIADCERIPHEKRPAPPDPHDKANANFIVRACNSHAAMLEALKEAIDLLESYLTDEERDAQHPRHRWPKLRSAIAQAEGKAT